MKCVALLCLALSGCVWVNPFGPYDDTEPCVTTVYMTFDGETLEADSATVSDTTLVCAEVG